MKNKIKQQKPLKTKNHIHKRNIINTSYYLWVQLSDNETYTINYTACNAFFNKPSTGKKTL